LFVILSEAKNLSSIATIKEGFFASLRMTVWSGSATFGIAVGSC